jgi:hypothetical protein
MDATGIDVIDNDLEKAGPGLDPSHRFGEDCSAKVDRIEPRRSRARLAWRLGIPTMR